MARQTMGSEQRNCLVCGHSQHGLFLSGACAERGCDCVIQRAKVEPDIMEIPKAHQESRPIYTLPEGVEAATPANPIMNAAGWCAPSDTMCEDSQPEVEVEAGQTDMVNHPPHYTSHPSGIECIQITEHMGFNLGNAMKYIWRADLKHDVVEDLRKAVWYIEREIAKRERDEHSS